MTRTGWRGLPLLLCSMMAGVVVLVPSVGSAAPADDEFPDYTAVARCGGPGLEDNTVLVFVSGTRDLTVDGQTADSPLLEPGDYYVVPNLDFENKPVEVLHFGIVFPDGGEVVAEEIVWDEDCANPECTTAAPCSPYVLWSMQCHQSKFTRVPFGQVNVSNTHDETLYELTMVAHWTTPPFTRSFPAVDPFFEPHETSFSVAELVFTGDGMSHEGLYFTFTFRVGSPDAPFVTQLVTRTMGPNDCDPPPVKCRGQEATITGSSGNDTIRGTISRDVIVALGGNDTIRARGGNDLICAGTGADTVYGQGGRDAMYGQGGNDNFIGGPGNDRHIGGRGRDTAMFKGSKQRVVVDLAKRTATGQGNDRLSSIESAFGSSHNDVLRGTTRWNTLYGSGGADRLVGRGGNDVLQGAGGRDRLLAGAGNDILIGGPRRDVCDGQAGFDRAAQCEVRRSIEQIGVGG